jgi:dephospho-CoA kinase
MIIIGLTGGIASGKSTASAYLKSLGAAVWDADEAARAVVAQGREGWEAIRREFGEEYFDEAGNLLREKLGDKVFNDAAALRKLNSLLHPAIIADMLRWLDKQRAKGITAAIIEAPLLFESGADRVADEVWALSCGKDEQISRLMQRGLDRENAAKRIKAQMSDSERRGRAHRVVTTCGPVEETQKQLKALYDAALLGEKDRHGN